MPVIHLTDLSIKNLKPPTKGSVAYLDRGLRGFGVRVSQNGTRSFFVMRGESRRRTRIGRYPDVTLKDARTTAMGLLAETDVVDVPEAPSLLFSDARKRFLAAAEHKNRPRTVSDYKRLLERHFEYDTTLGELTRQQVTETLDGLVKTPSERQHAAVAIRTMLNWCVREQLLSASPLASMRLPRTTPSRERVLTPDELATVYEASLDFDGSLGFILSLAILTGQRRGEIAALRWEWIDRQAKTITIPGAIAKNRHTHLFPYGDLVGAVLERVPEAGDLLFPPTRSHVRGRPTTTYNGFTKDFPKFRGKVADLPHFTIHDLRRTFASVHAELGTPLHIVERLLNHRTGVISGVTATYNRYSYMDEMRQAVKIYDQHIANLLKPRGGNRRGGASLPTVGDRDTDRRILSVG